MGPLGPLLAGAARVRSVRRPDGSWLTVRSRAWRVEAPQAASVAGWRLPVFLGPRLPRPGVRFANVNDALELFLDFLLFCGQLAVGGAAEPGKVHEDEG